MVLVREWPVVIVHLARDQARGAGSDDGLAENFDIVKATSRPSRRIRGWDGGQPLVAPHASDHRDAGERRGIRRAAGRRCLPRPAALR